eukprot:12523-Heterococcus_DN1.PRE.3
MAAQQRETLPAALVRWAATQPDKRLWSWLDDDGAVTESLTYAALETSTAALAAHLLQTTSLKAGDRVLLVHPPSLHFIVAFVACLRVGVIAVPVYPPDPRKLKKDISAFTKTAESCGAKVALTSSMYDHVKKAAGIKSKLSRDDAKWPELDWIVTDKGKAADHKRHSSSSSNSSNTAVELSQLAFLQYTSGKVSTASAALRLSTALSTARHLFRLQRTRLSILMLSLTGMLTGMLRSELNAIAVCVLICVLNNQRSKGCEDNSWQSSAQSVAHTH